MSWHVDHDNNHVFWETPTVILFEQDLSWGWCTRDHVGFGRLLVCPFRQRIVWTEVGLWEPIIAPKRLFFKINMSGSRGFTFFFQKIHWKLDLRCRETTSNNHLMFQPIRIFRYFSFASFRLSSLPLPNNKSDRRPQRPLRPLTAQTWAILQRLRRREMKRSGKRSGWERSVLVIYSEVGQKQASW